MILALLYFFISIIHALDNLMIKQYIYYSRDSI